jgi:hypothetical protein
MSLRKLLPILAIAGAFAIMTGASGAFTASNTVPTSNNLGFGSKIVTGYQVTNIAFTPTEATPSYLNAVAFQVTPDGAGGAPTTVKLQLKSGGTWYAATNTGGNTWQVTTPVLESNTLLVSDVDSFTILAYQ